MRDLFRKLPTLTEEEDCSAETTEEYLNAWIQYQKMIRENSGSLPETVLQNYLKNLACLPCISLQINTDDAAEEFVSVKNAFQLLSSLTQEEAEQLLDGKIQKIIFTLDVCSVTLEKKEEKAFRSLLEKPVLIESFRISLKKTVKEDGASNDYLLKSVPLTLSITCTGGGKATEGYERSFHAAVLPEAAGNDQKASLLKTSSDMKFTAEASSFPAVFTLMYEDKKIAEEKPSEPGSQPGGSSGGSSSGSGSSGNHSSSGSSSDDHHDDDDDVQVPDYEKEFWEQVRSLIQKAKPGETVNVNAVTYDKMPENVMDALRKNPYVALIVRWDGGDPVIIPALTALAKEEGRVYYPLSYLSGLYQTINAALTQPLPSVNAAPQITAPVQSSSDYQPTPESSGIKKGSSSGRNEDSSAETDTDDAKASEEETAEEQEGAASDVPRTDPSGDSQVLDTAQVSQVQENRSPVTIIVLIASAALLVLVAALVAILLTMKKR